ncbi:hypothetical protein [Rhizosaccharibacter radicis]|uniref:Uncharacterized protein n=1 Tax=Rhizosaccharibacter radicis TaxID=2782605 RepID=A0ABT1VUM8_9PROT|nr:hypothetical protein [Acetobacteraceae bacterium KSS12]
MIDVLLSRVRRRASAGEAVAAPASGPKAGPEAGPGPRPEPPVDPGVPEGYAEGWSAPMDGSLFVANIELHPGGAAGVTLLRDRRVRWRRAPSMPAVAAEGVVHCFDEEEGGLAESFWAGRCWIHSWRSLGVPGR